jgi:hypothetical protein
MFRRLAAAALLLLAAWSIAVAQPAGDERNDRLDMEIAALVSEITDASLPVRIERAFLLTLRCAADAIRQGDVSRAQMLLRTFAFEVRGVRRAKRISPDAADPLIEKAEKLIATMTEPAPQ